MHIKVKLNVNVFQFTKDILDLTAQNAHQKVHHKTMIIDFWPFVTGDAGGGGVGVLWKKQVNATAVIVLSPVLMV